MKRISKKLNGILLIVAALIALSWIWSIRVTTITCKTGDQPCSDQVLSQLNDIKGKSLFLTNFTNWQKQHHSLGIKSIHKNLSGQIIVTLAAQPPIYQLLFADGQLFSVQETGELQAATEKTLPTINFRQNCQTAFLNQNQVTQQFHQQMQELILLYQKYTLPAWETLICLNQELTLLKIANQPNIVLPTTDLSQGIQRLHLILEQFKTEKPEYPIQEIDLRFKLPVLRESVTIQEE